MLSRQGEIVTASQIEAHLAKGRRVSRWHQRIGELRDDGWDILGSEGRASLKPGEYLLEHGRPTLPSRRPASRLPAAVRRAVIARDGACRFKLGSGQECGLADGDIDPETGRPAKLSVDHDIPRSAGGSDDPSNLQAMCRRHQLAKRNFYAGARPYLPAVLKAASRQEKRDAYEWLAGYFGQELPPAPGGSS